MKMLQAKLKSSLTSSIDSLRGSKRWDLGVKTCKFSSFRWSDYESIYSRIEVQNKDPTRT